mgnify:CR=1 FL=1
MSNYRWYFQKHWIFQVGDEFITDYDNEVFSSYLAAKTYLDYKLNKQCEKNQS